MIMLGSKRIWSSIFRRSAPRRACGDGNTCRLKLEVLEDRRLLSLSVGNLVWNDLNSNGLQDTGEPGIAGAVVEVFQSADATVGNGDDVSCNLTTTDVAGNYLLDELTEGTNYFLRFRSPTGYAFTQKNAGPDPALDSDADSSGTTAVFSLVAGANRTDLDAGLLGAAAPFGFAFNVGNATAGQSVQKLAVDAAGNTYIAANFQGTVDFDPGPGVFNLTSSGSSSNALIAKYTGAGALLWTRRVSTNAINSLAAAADGSVYLTGYYSASGDFDPGPGVINLVYAGGNADLYLAKLDALGNIAWVKGIGGTGYDVGRGLAVAPNGDAVVTGSFQTTVDFDPGDGVANLTSGGYSDIFVARYSPTGALVWCDGMNGPNSDDGYDVAVSPDGNICATGEFSGTVDFNPGSGTNSLTTGSYQDAFVVKLDAAGNYLWAKNYDGTGNVYPSSIAVGPDGGPVTIGYFYNTVDFDPGSGLNKLTAPGSSSSRFIAKLGINGDFAWARAATFNIKDLVVDADNGVFSVGSYSGTVDFDLSADAAFNLSGGPGFLWKLDSAGSFAMAAGLGGSPAGLDLFPDGSVVVAGSFSGAADFDPRGSTMLLDSGSYGDIFAFKLSPDAAPTDAALARSTIPLTSRTGTIVGQLFGSDPDPGEVFSYRMIDSAGGRFTVDGSLVRLANAALLEPTGVYSIVIQVLDSLGTSANKTLSITVSDEPTSSIGDRVWNDLNGNGVQDAGEPGVAGAVIELRQSMDGAIGNADDCYFGQTTSDATGNYLLGGLLPDGSYYVTVRPPAAYGFSAADAGGDDALDSDVNGTGISALISVAANSARTDVDVGLVGTAPAFGFAFACNGTSNTIARAMTADAQGNVYITGGLNGTVDFDPGPAAYSLTGASYSRSNVFVAKYTRSGALCWARTFPGSASNDELGYAIAVDASGNVYTTGSFVGTVDFDPGPGTFNVTGSVANNDVFISKLDADGNFVWARGVGGSGADVGNGLAVAADGVYVTGSFSGTGDFDPGNGTYNLVNAGNTDVFLLKLDEAGNFAWARGIGGTGYDVGNAITISPDGYVYATGSFSASADFDPSASTFNLTSAGAGDVFVSKFDLSGNFVWARGMGGTCSDAGTAIAISPDGGICTSGNFQGTADFDPETTVANLSSAGGYDVFVTKLSAGGSLVWARGMGGANDDSATGTTVSSNGSVSTTGYFNGRADFDPSPAGIFVLTNVSPYNTYPDIFLSNLDAAGNFVSAVRVGGTSNDYSYALALDADGSVYMTGGTGESADFDPRGGQYNVNGSGWGIFVSKWLPDRSPTDINMSSTTIAPHSPYGTVVGELSASDPDPLETLTYELLDSAGGRFALTDSLLRVANGDLVEAGNSYAVVVRVRDSFGLKYDKTLALTAGDTTPRSSVAGVVWNDLNGNGLQDPGEQGVAGAVVEAFRSLDAVADNGDEVSWTKTSTDAAGNYRLDGLMSGVNYDLVFRPPVGYTFTTPDAGSDDTQDSDANALGATSLFVLNPGEMRSDLAAGLTGAVPAFGLAFGIPTSSATRMQLTTTDAAGNVYVVERYSSGLTDIDPGPRVFGADPTAGTAFVAKYTPTGAFCWGHSFNLDMNGLAIAPDGGVLLDGSFMGIADCDPGARGHSISTYNRSLFFMKLDSAGNFLWVRQMGGDNGWGDLDTIALDASGNIYATGGITGTIDIDPGPATQNITNSGTNGDLILGLDANGGYLWSRQITCSSNLVINDIAVGPDGSLAMTGVFYGTADFDPGPDTYNLTSSGASDIFVLKLDAARNFAWALRLGGNRAGYVQEGAGPTSDERGIGIAVDAAGSVNITGRFVGTADFDPGPGVFNLTSSNCLAHPDPYNNTEYSDIFVAKLTALGGFVWAANFGGGLYETGTDIAVAPGGGVFIAGSVRGAADFDSSSDQFALINPSGGTSAFIAKLNSDGSLGWVAAAASGSGCNIAVSSDGSVYATGSFYGVVDFDPRPGTFNIGVASTTEMFVWKLKADQPPTAIALSSSTVPEHSRRGTVVGQLSAVDADSDEAFTYELLDTAGGRFMLAGSVLQVDNGTLLNANHSPYEVIVRVRDSLGAVCESAFTIAVTQQPLCSVGDRAWNDLNANGVQDIGEPGLPGVVVEIYQRFNGVIGDADDLSLGQTETDANGNYALTGLNPGDSYYLVFRAPVGCAFTLADAGDNDALDSDVNSVGNTAVFTLAAGDVRSDLDAGLTGTIPNFGFAFGPTYGHSSNVTSTAVDAAGNVYVIGYFQQTAEFDPGPGIYSLTSTLTDGNIFVAKYSQTGSLYWARSFPTKCDIGMALGTDGSVYVNGTFSRTMDFDPGPSVFSVPTVVPSVFVVKLDTAGVFQWVRTIGQTDIIMLTVSAIATDSSNNVFTSGVFFGRALDFDPGPDEVSIIPDNQDIYVWKLDSQGNFGWARDFQVSLSGAIYSRGMAVSPDGGVNVAGFFMGTADFDPGAATYNLTSAGAYDSFVVKLNSEGNFLWADRIGGTADDRDYSLAVAPDNSVYTGAGGIVKLNSLGNVLWTRSASVSIYGLTVSPDGSVCATGDFSGTVDFDPGSGAFNLSNSRRSAYVWTLNSDGNFVSAGAATTTNGSSTGRAIAAALDGSIYTTGTCLGTTDFDPGVDTFNLTTSMFLWKLRANHAPLANAGGPYTVIAGQLLILNGTASSDPDAAAGDYLVSYQWDIGADGSYEYSGVSPGIPWAQLAGLPLNTPLRLRVTDRSGATGAALTTLRLIYSPPTVANVVLDDDTAQRSMITSVIVSFSALVTTDEGAFEVVRADATDGSVDVTTSVSEENGRTVVTLRFGGILTEFNSLVDGDYRLIVHGDRIHDSFSGLALDGDANGQSGGDYVFGDRLFDAFFRFFGDSDGDRDVDNLDFARFRNSYNKSAGDSAYAVCFDNNADGSVNTLDFNIFRLNYLMRLSTTLASGDLANLTLTRSDDGLVHIYKTGTTIDVAPPRMSAVSPISDIPGQLILCDALTVDFSEGNPIAANGVSFSGAALRIVGGSSNDNVTITDSTIIRDGSAPLYFANASGFSFDLGGGDDRLTISDATLIIGQDNAISTGAAVTIDGGVLNFSGHSATIGDLVVKNGGQAMLTAIENAATTVESGTLTAMSIVCDTLTIGAAPTVSNQFDQAKPRESAHEPLCANATASVTDEDQARSSTAGVVPRSLIVTPPVVEPSIAGEGGSSPVVAATAKIAPVSTGEVPLAPGPSVFVQNVLAARAAISCASFAEIAFDKSLPETSKYYLPAFAAIQLRTIDDRSASHFSAMQFDDARSRLPATIQAVSTSSREVKTQSAVAVSVEKDSSLAALRTFIGDYHDGHSADQLDMESLLQDEPGQQIKHFAAVVDAVFAEGEIGNC
jgi:hypothetical protein